MLGSWQATPLTDISRSRIIAICLPELESSKHSFHRATFDDLDPTKEYDPSEVFHSEYKWLTEVMLDLKLSEASVLYTDLVNSGAIEPNTRPINSPNTENKISNTELNYANPFQALIAKILLKHPEITVKRLFRILAVEAHADIDEREFDTENVLADEVDGVILWNDVTRKTGISKCSYNTLKNPVRDVKIAMKVKKD